MPNTSAGTHAPASAELLAEVDSMNALDVPLPVLLRGARQAFADRVGDPGRNIGARAGQDTDDDAQHVAAHLLAPVDGDHAAPAGEQIADARLRNRAGLRMPLATLRSTSDTANRPIIAAMKLTPAEHVDIAEGEARHAGRVVEADGGHEQADEQADRALERRTGADEGGAGQAQQRHPEILQTDENFSATSAR
jgi:hypothetical protein